MASLIVSAIVGLAFSAGSIVFWLRVPVRGERWFRARVERRFGVSIGRSWRGHWKVTAGPGSPLKHLLIELLQLGYFMGLMLVWCTGAVIVALLAMLLRRLG